MASTQQPVGHVGSLEDDLVNGVGDDYSDMEGGSLIGFVTCLTSTGAALLTDDDADARTYLQQRGLRVELVVWNTPVATLVKDGYQLLIIRSPWDYHTSETNRQQFVSWLEALDAGGLRLANSFATLQWNLDKHYLADLAAASIPIPPTVYLEPGEPLSKVSEMMNSWSAVVMKPTISASAADTFCFRDSGALQRFLAGDFQSLRGTRTWIIQQYCAQIETAGELSLVFINESYSHCVRKMPPPGQWLVQLGGVSTYQPAPATQELAAGVLQQVKEILRHHQRPEAGDSVFLLYCRIDIIGTDLIGEVELVEPELFFLDRGTNQPQTSALVQFYRGVQRCLHHSDPV